MAYKKRLSKKQAMFLRFLIYRPSSNLKYVKGIKNLLPNLLEDEFVEIVNDAISISETGEAMLRSSKYSFSEDEVTATFLLQN